MDISTIIIVSVCGGIGFVAAIFFLYRKYLLFVKKRQLHESRMKWKLEHRNTLTGNFVMTYPHPVEEHYTIENEYVLGKGSYGVVVKGIHKESKVEFAIKFVNTESGKRHRIEREYKLLKDIDHPNIVRLFAVYDTAVAVGFVMELCTGGHLGNWVDESRINIVRKRSEKASKNIMRQLLSAVAHMHDRGICHRDIKLQNILRETEKQHAQIKLIDFGLGTRFIGACPLKTRCGTLYSTAPEVLRESYDEKCDIWSCGVVGFTLLAGRKPFEALVLYPASGEDEDGKAAVMANILMGRCHYRHRDWKHVSRNAMDFTKRMMTHDYRQRWSAQEALEHPWFLDSEGDEYHQYHSADADDNHSEDAVTTTGEHRTRKFSSTSIMSESSGGEVNMVQQAMKNLKRQADASVIHQTSMLAVAYSMPSGKTADRRAFFQSFDVDKNGTLSKDEFRNAMLACNIFSPQDTEKLSAEDIDCIFHSVDVNGDNQISFTEFLAATLDPRDFDIHSLNSAFQLMDRDQKGYITQSDMERVLSVTSAARKRSVQMSAAQLSSLNGTPSQSQKSNGSAPSIKHQNSDPLFRYGKVGPAPDDDDDNNSAEEHTKSHNGSDVKKGGDGGSSGGRGRSMSLGNVLRRPSMLKDIMPALTAPRRSSMTSAAIFPMGANSMSEDGEHTEEKKPTSTRIPILSMKSSPSLLNYTSSRTLAEVEKAEDIDPVMTAQIQKAIKLLDRGGNGVVSYVDFLLALTENEGGAAESGPEGGVEGAEASITPFHSPRSRGSSTDDVNTVLPRPHSQGAKQTLAKCSEGGSGVSQSAEGKSSMS